MKNYEKIIQLIKEDKEIAENLFYFQEFRDDVSLWKGEDEDNYDYTNIEWLFITYQENLTLIGINLVDETIWCIDNEGDFHQDCDALENLPYKILSIESQYTKNEDVKSYYEKYPKYSSLLLKYEQWCKENNIQLDINKIYHDNDGNLFDKFE